MLTVVEALERTIALLIVRLLEIRSSTLCKPALAFTWYSSLDLKPVGTLPTSKTVIKALLSKANLAESMRFYNNVSSAKASVTVIITIVFYSFNFKNRPFLLTSRWRDSNSHRQFTRLLCCHWHHTCIIWWQGQDLNLLICRLWDCRALPLLHPCDVTKFITRIENQIM